MSVERDNLIEEIVQYDDEAKHTRYQSNASSMVPVPEAVPEPFANDQSPGQPGASRASPGPSQVAPRTMKDVQGPYAQLTSQPNDQASPPPAAANDRKAGLAKLKLERVEEQVEPATALVPNTHGNHKI